MFHLRVTPFQAPVCGVKQGAPLWQFELAIYEADIVPGGYPRDLNWLQKPFIINNHWSHVGPQTLCLLLFVGL